jgi:DNA-binding CsgD family transcriptional regulator
VRHSLSQRVASKEERARHAALAITAPDAAVAGQLESVALVARRRGASVAAAELASLAVDRTPTGSRFRMDRERRQLLGELAWASTVSARARAALAAARGQLNQSLERADLAVTRSRSLSMPFELGRSLLVLSGVHRRRRSKRAAGIAAEEAHAVFAELGAHPWAQRSTAAYRALGLGPRSAAGLTATERRVAGLAADGWTNPEIARRLSMSRKTVEFNLGKVYRKLQIRNRAQLAKALATVTSEKSGELPGSSPHRRT